jgi:hypothetical protein
MNPNFYQKARELIAAQIARDVVSNLGTEEVEQAAIALQALEKAKLDFYSKRHELACQAMDRFRRG